MPSRTVLLGVPPRRRERSVAWRVYGAVYLHTAPFLTERGLVNGGQRIFSALGRRRPGRGRAPAIEPGSTLAGGHPKGVGVDAGEERRMIDFVGAAIGQLGM